MKSISKNCILCLLIFSCLVACRKKENYTDSPTLEFKSLIKIDNGTNVDADAKLTTYFTDGKGNIGALKDDTSKNFFITYYELQNGNWIAPTEFLDNFNVQLPQFLPEGIEEPLDGYIELIVNINNPNSNYDTIKFECYLVDRNGLKSNVITTDTLIVNK